jgi:tetratricopeptide (TPR) repeat protein
MACRRLLLADDWLAPGQAYPQARAAAEKGRAADSTSLEVQGDLQYLTSIRLRRRPQNIAQNGRAEPNSAIGHRALARALHAHGRFDEAIVEFRRTSELDPAIDNDARIARLYLQLGRYDDAIAEAQRLLALNLWPMVLRVMGDAQLAKGSAGDALNTYRRGLAVDSSFLRLRTAEARALSALNQRADDRDSSLAGARSPTSATFAVKRSPASTSRSATRRGLSSGSSGLTAIGPPVCRTCCTGQCSVRCTAIRGGLSCRTRWASADRRLHSSCPSLGLRLFAAEEQHAHAADDLAAQLLVDASDVHPSLTCLPWLLDFRSTHSERSCRQRPWGQWYKRHRIK